MASAFSHAVAALGIGACFYQRNIPKRVWLIGAACSVIPDLDVIGFRFGIRYGDFLGVPVGSVAWDFLVSISLLAVFKDRIVDVVAAANFGYLLVFVLLPLSYVSIKNGQRRDSDTFNLPRLMIPVAVTIAIYNIMLLVIGGAQWGVEVASVSIGYCHGADVYSVPSVSEERNQPWCIGVYCRLWLGLSLVCH